MARSNSLLQLQRTSVHPLAHRLAFDVLSNNVVGILYVPDLVNGDDVRMIEGGSGPCFLGKAPDPLGVCCELWGKQFEGNSTPQPRILREVDLTHPT